jgi:hypothetical protein
MLDSHAMIKRTDSALISREVGMVSMLEDRLVRAAEVAIRNERPSLGHRPDTVKGLTLELTIGSDSQVKDAVVYLERRTSGAALLDRQQMKGR